MTNNSKAKGAWVAILAMFFLFAMISFVTNLAAPLGTIWKNNYEWSGMLGNLMNFLAYGRRLRGPAVTVVLRYFRR